jgi:hypothetical protein
VTFNCLRLARIAAPICSGFLVVFILPIGNIPYHGVSVK